jgi:hypothetical protein
LIKKVKASKVQTWSAEARKRLSWTSARTFWVGVVFPEHLRDPDEHLSK